MKFQSSRKLKRKGCVNLKFFAIVRYNQSGQPFKFYDPEGDRWCTELTTNLLFSIRKDADLVAEKVDGFVETYVLVKRIAEGLS
jgi:hypothetical protein